MLLHKYVICRGFKPIKICDRLLIKSAWTDPGLFMEANNGEYILPSSLPGVSLYKLDIVGSILDMASPSQVAAGFEYVVYLVFVAPDTEPCPKLECVSLDWLSRCSSLIPFRDQADAQTLQHLFMPMRYWFVLDDQDRVLIENGDFPHIDLDSFKREPVLQNFTGFGSFVQYTTDPVSPETGDYLRAVLRYRGHRWLPLKDFEYGWPRSLMRRGGRLEDEIKRVLFGHEFQRYQSRVSVYDLL